MAEIEKARSIDEKDRGITMQISALTAGLGGHQNFLIADLRRWRFIGDKGHLEGSG